MPDVEVTNLRVTVTVGATVNLGDFNNYKPEFTISGDVPEGTSPTAVKNKLEAAARVWLDESVEAVAGKKIR